MIGLQRAARQRLLRIPGHLLRRRRIDDAKRAGEQPADVFLGLFLILGGFWLDLVRVDQRATRRLCRWLRRSSAALRVIRRRRFCGSRLRRSEANRRRIPAGRNESQRTALAGLAERRSGPRCCCRHWPPPALCRPRKCQAIGSAAGKGLRIHRVEICFHGSAGRCRRRHTELPLARDVEELFVRRKHHLGRMRAGGVHDGNPQAKWRSPSRLRDRPPQPHFVPTGSRRAGAPSRVGSTA